MSLDVYLVMPGVMPQSQPDAIFIREDGATRKITRAEWNTRHPGREPYVCSAPMDTETVYSGNITHNLGCMARAAGLYGVCWQPKLCGIMHAQQLIQPLRIGLEVLEQNQEYFEQFTPKNGWGSYNGLVGFARGYWLACGEYPQARVSVWR